MKKKIELAAPGGSLEKIEYAYHFGADAAYAGIADFSLRARINEFNEKKLEKAVRLSRRLGKKIYFTLNIYAHERHLAEIKRHLKFIKKIKPDAVIISDPGIIHLAKKLALKTRIHLSTQANTTNSEAVRFWEKQGVSRIILAREVTLDEIKKIRKACPKIELEYFVHGAMCMSLSGRCLLSRWMRSRSANLGDCVQPCRWRYKVQSAKCKVKSFGVSLRETDHSKINSQEVIIEEDEHGTFFLNSKDLCLIEYLGELSRAGINAFKIEGRTKSAYYVACAAKAYRKVLDAIKSGKNKAEIKKISASEKKELEKLVNRGYSTGFLLGKEKWENDFEKTHQRNGWQFVGEILGGEKNNRVHPVESPTRDRGAALPQFNRVKIHNILKEKEKVEIITPEEVYSDKVLEIRNYAGEKVESGHGGGISAYFVRFGRVYPEKSMIRKKLRLGKNRKTG